MGFFIINEIFSSFTFLHDVTVQYVVRRTIPVHYHHTQETTVPTICAGGIPVQFVVQYYILGVQGTSIINKSARKNQSSFLHQTKFPPVKD